MAIYLNGAPNPQAVLFNGAPMDTVWASVDGGHSTYQVWGVKDQFPSTIGTMTGSKGSGLDIWVRDSTLVRSWVEQWTDGTLHAYGKYSCDVSLDVTYPTNEFVGAAYGGTANINWQPSTVRGALSLSGFPSGYSFNSITPSNIVNLDFKKTVEGSHSVIDRIINVDCTITIVPNIFTIAGDSGITGNYYLFTAVGGFIYQSAATLLIEKRL